MTRAKVDADHTVDVIARRSITGFIVHANGTPMFWHSKNHSSVELSSFSSEFMATKDCCEYLLDHRHIL